MTNVFPILRHKENTEERKKTVRRTIACGMYSYDLGGTRKWLGTERHARIRVKMTED